MQEYFRVYKPIRTQKEDWHIANLLGDLDANYRSLPKKLYIVKKRRNKRLVCFEDFKKKVKKIPLN